MADLRDLIMQRVDLVELIGQWVALQQAGREWRGRCPFHDEKTASFYVNNEKGVYHCHGCKAGGTAIDFVMRIENLEFKDALDWFVQRYNIPRPERSPQQAQAQGLKERLFQLNAAAAAFFRQSLGKPQAERAQAYLAKRGLGAREVADFDLGYAPREWQALADLLLGKNARASELVQLSLARQRGGDNAGPSGQGNYIDFFRDRLIFPIRNVTGRIVSFAGRALSDENPPKYLNTAATPLYDKSAVLYNLDRAKGSLREQGAVVVEGYMDVIGLASAGVANTVATCGTALTEQHVKMLTRYTDRIYLCFDSDKAGRSAAWSAGKLFLHSGYDARIVVLPSGKDPDDWARAQGEHAPQAWQSLLAGSISVVRYWLDYQQEQHPQADPTTQREWVVQLRGLYQGVPDELLRQDIQREVASALRLGGQEVAGLLGAQNVALPGGARPHAQPPRAQLKQQAQQKALLQGSQPLEDEFARRLLTDARFLTLCQRLAGNPEEPLHDPQFLSSPAPRALLATLREGVDPGRLAYDETHAAYVAELLNRGEPLLDGDEQLLRVLSNAYYQRQVDALMAEYAAAENASDEAAMLSIHLQIAALKKRIKPVGSW